MSQAVSVARRLTAALVLLTTSLSAQAQTADPTPFCGNDGVWIQILGGGGPELSDSQASASYVVFVDNKARLLVDTAPDHPWVSTKPARTSRTWTRWFSPTCTPTTHRTFPRS